MRLDGEERAFLERRLRNDLVRGGEFDGSGRRVTGVEALEN